MKKATIVKWLKKEGEPVGKGESIVQIETEKVAHRIEAPTQGILLKIVAPERSVLSVGTIVKEKDQLFLVLLRLLGL